MKISPAGKTTLSFQDLSASFLGGISVFLLLFLSLAFTSYLLIQEKLGQERDAVRIELSDIRTRLETELFERISLERGLVTYVKMKPGLSFEEYTEYAHALIGKDPVIRNAAILKDTTIIFVYPLKGNESAISKDLGTVDSQKEAVFKVRDTGKTVIVGPVELVQGGRGLVSRMPIYVDGKTGDRTYWGQASVVLDLVNLFFEARTFTSLSLALAIMNKTENGEVLGGDKEVFKKLPVELKITIPETNWVLGAIPINGWKNPLFLHLGAFSGSFVLATAIGYLIGFIILTRAKMREMAFHDTLTGLPNRKLFWDRFVIVVSGAARRKERVVVFMLDLDKFKDVNDTYGHAAGDALLIAIAVRLQSLIRTTDTLARLGGDEFAVISTIEAGHESQSGLHERLTRAFQSPFQCGNLHLHSSASIGQAIWPDDGDTPESVLAKADSLMYDLKRR